MGITKFLVVPVGTVDLKITKLPGFNFLPNSFERLLIKSKTGLGFLAFFCLATGVPTEMT